MQGWESGRGSSSSTSTLDSASARVTYSSKDIWQYFYSLAIDVTFSVAIIAEKSYSVGSILHFWKTLFNKFNWFLTIQPHPLFLLTKTSISGFSCKQDFWMHEWNWLRAILNFQYFPCLLKQVVWAQDLDFLNADLENVTLYRQFHWKIVYRGQAGSWAAAPTNTGRPTQPGWAALVQLSFHIEMTTFRSCLRGPQVPRPGL